MATQSLNHTMAFSNVTKSLAGFEIDPSTMAIFDLTQEVPTANTADLATALSHRYFLKPTVKLPQVAENTSRESLGASFVQQPVVAISSPTLIAQNGVSSSTTEGTNPQKNNPLTYVAEDAGSQHLVADNNLRNGLTKLGLETTKGFRWADDPDLEPLPGFEDKPKRDEVQKPSQEGFKGLKNSRWANHHHHQSPFPATGSAAKKDTQKQRSGESFKGLASSRWADHDEASIPAVTSTPKKKHTTTAKLLGNKLKRELAHFGLNNSVQSTKNASLPPRPPFQSAPKSSPQPPRMPNNGPRWNNTKPRNSRRNYHQAKHESPREVPRAHMDVEESSRESKMHGLKTLKDSRWADKEADKETNKEEGDSREYQLRIVMDMEEFKRDVEKYGLKTLKDSRWAN
ncbi:hypothetical protein O1611_g2375 [Lasiodiplodia mahajangana]|uniref:Uncharacterized protein n=1 Tax=Lasiodiplodia mahajangana TaxID=1108764 RepID=A0ACC2JUT8_9PEZI|nr:hypothetical protein O1611_g2375 [Lasiodiplodia mahajangana]